MTWFQNEEASLGKSQWKRGVVEGGGVMLLCVVAFQDGNPQMDSCR